MTELTWEGKYKDGKKVTPVRIALPFQTIETVNESAEDRKRTIDMFMRECLNYDANDSMKTMKVSEKESNESLSERLKLERNYKHFICDLYSAKTLDGYTWFHGAKAGRMIHVGSVDAPVTVEDIKAAIKEFWKLVGKEKSVKTNGIDFLGWDFAFDVNETAKQFQLRIRLIFLLRKFLVKYWRRKQLNRVTLNFMN